MDVEKNTKDIFKVLKIGAQIINTQKMIIKIKYLQRGIKIE